MLLRFFRINDPYRLLGLLVLLLLFSATYFIHAAPCTLQELRNFVLGEAMADGKRMYIEIIDSTAPFMAGILGVVSWCFGRSLPVQHLLALFVVFFQASRFAILLINNKAYNDNTYVPALIFGLLCFFSFDVLSFSPELLGSTMLLLALNNLFKEIEFQIQRDEIILNLGIYLSIASLTIFSYSIFLLATIFILFVFTRLTTRKLFLLLFGFGLPHILLNCVYYLRGEFSALWRNFYFPNLTVHGAMQIDLKSIFFLSALPLCYFVFSLFMLNREARFTKYQSQLFQIMFQWMTVCVVEVFLLREFTPHSLVIFIPPLAYFISHYLLLIRRKWIAETMLLIFMAGLLSINLLTRLGEVRNVNYAGLFPNESPYGAQIAGERLMVLTDDLGLYQKNRLAGYFLDWSLSKETFEQPDYYENVLLVDRAFKTDPPDCIIDPSHLMEKYLEKIPAVRQRYCRDGILYRRQGAR